MMSPGWNGWIAGILGDHTQRRLSCLNVPGSLLLSPFILLSSWTSAHNVYTILCDIIPAVFIITLTHWQMYCALYTLYTTIVVVKWWTSWLPFIFICIERAWFSLDSQPAKYHEAKQQEQHTEKRCNSEKKDNIAKKRGTHTHLRVSSWVKRSLWSYQFASSLSLCMCLSVPRTHWHCTPPHEQLLAFRSFLDVCVFYFLGCPFLFIFRFSSIYTSSTLSSSSPIALSFSFSIFFSSPSFACQLFNIPVYPSMFLY